MEVQVFGVKKNPDTRKALRFFAERRIRTHFVDFAERAPSLGELRRFTQRFGLEAADQLRAANDLAEQPWTVEFWIADTPRANASFNIPFFSKISLRDEASNLVAMNYRVIVKFIGLEAEHIGA